MRVCVRKKVVSKKGDRRKQNATYNVVNKGEGGLSSLYLIRVMARAASPIMRARIPRWIHMYVDVYPVFLTRGRGQFLTWLERLIVSIIAHADGSRHIEMRGQTNRQ